MLTTLATSPLVLVAASALAQTSGGACPPHVPMNNTCNGYCGNLGDKCTQDKCFSCVVGFDDGCLSSCTGSDGRDQWAANSPNNRSLYWRDTDTNACYDMAERKVYPEKNVCGHGGKAAYCGSAYVPKFVDGTLYAAANFILEQKEQECGQVFSGWASTGAATFKVVLKMVSYKRAIEEWVGFRLYVPGSGAGENTDGLSQVYPALYTETCMGANEDTFAACRARATAADCGADQDCVWAAPMSCEGDNCAYLHFGGGIQTKSACALLGEGSAYQAACEDVHIDLAGKWQSAHVLLQSLGPATTEEIGNFDLHVGVNPNTTHAAG